MKDKNKKSSPVWLIIILAAIIFLLNSIITSLKHRQQLSLIYQELETVSQQAEELEKQKQDEIKALQQQLEAAQESSPSASLEEEELEASFPAQLKSQISTFSGETP